MKTLIMRKCKNCEYFYKRSDYYDSTCQFTPPVVSGNNQYGRFPITKKDSFCSKWEPKWIDNPVIVEAWELFQTTLILAK